MLSKRTVLIQKESFTTVWASSTDSLIFLHIYDILFAAAFLYVRILVKTYISCIVISNDFTIENA